MQRLYHEQDEASRIQQNLLPRSAPLLRGFQLEAEWVPAGAVGGDWYDYIPVRDGRVALVLADVSGKGMPAALLMSAARGIVRSLAPLAGGPGEVLARVNQMLLRVIVQRDCGDCGSPLWKTFRSKPNTISG